MNGMGLGIGLRLPPRARSGAPGPATAYTLSVSPTSADPGDVLTVTVTANGTFAGTVTLDDGGAAGSFGDATLTWAGEAGGKQTTYDTTGTTPGVPVTISATDDGGLPDPDDVTVTISGDEPEPDAVGAWLAEELWSPIFLGDLYGN